MQTLSDAGKGAYEFLGGQDFIAVFSPLAADVDVSWMCAYDQKVNELLDTQVTAYTTGEKDKDTAVADFKAGKDKAIGFLVGQAMKETKGKANPQILNKLFIEELKK